MGRELTSGGTVAGTSSGWGERNTFGLLREALLCESAEEWLATVHNEYEDGLDRISF